MKKNCDKKFEWFYCMCLQWCKMFWEDLAGKIKNKIKRIEGEEVLGKQMIIGWRKIMVNFFEAKGKDIESFGVSEN